MSIKDRFQRFVSRKSLSSGHSSSSSNSDASDAPPMPYASSSGTCTPTTIPISHAPASIHPSPANISTSLSKTSPTSTSFLSKTLTWRSSHGESSKKEKKRSSGNGNRSSDRKDKAGTAAARKRVHPSERPLTEANLRQQEALSQFKWEFGRSQGRRNSLGGWSVNSGISPCCSRRPSLIAPPGA